MKTQHHGLATMIAAIAIQLTSGIAYIWSVFQTGIAKGIFNGDNARAALAFSLLLSMLGIGGIIGGKIAAKTSMRFTVFIGGLILSAGFLFASFVRAEFAWLLWVSYGIMGGMGMGFTYSISIACAQKWYPTRKGLVTGLIVCAVGMGGVVFAPIVERLLAYYGGSGVGELATFRTLSVLFFTVCTIGSFFMRTPPETAAAPAATGSVPAAAAANSANAPRHYTTGEMLRTPQFYLISATFMFACMGGLMMIAFAKPIAVAKGLAETATVGVLAIALANSLGRLLWGFVSDKIGRMNTVFTLLAGAALLSLFVNAATGVWVFVLIAFIGLFYGGILGTFPSLTADIFGTRHMAVNYGFVLIGFGIGAIAASQIAGIYRNLAAAKNDISLMFPAFVIASCCAAAGIVMMLILKKMSR